MSEQMEIQNEEMRPCEGCGGLTKKNIITLECWECRGEGSVEEDDPLTGNYFWRKCWQCNGVGSYKIVLWYCSSECYYMDNYED